jgi:hypothetical protein
MSWFDSKCEQMIHVVKPSLHRTRWSLRQCGNGRERSPGASNPRATSRSGRLLLRWSLHGLYRCLSIETRHMLRIGLPALPLSRHGSRPKPVHLTLPLRFHPGQALLQKNHQCTLRLSALRAPLPPLLPCHSRALEPIAPLCQAFQLPPRHLPSARFPAVPG